MNVPYYQQYTGDHPQRREVLLVELLWVDHSDTVLKRRLVEGMALASTYFRFVWYLPASDVESSNLIGWLSNCCYTLQFCRLGLDTLYC